MIQLGKDHFCTIFPKMIQLIGALGLKGRFHRSTLCGAYSSEASLKKAKRLKDCPLLYYFAEKSLILCSSERLQTSNCPFFSDMI